MDEIETLTWRELVCRTGSPAAARVAISQGLWWRVVRGAYVACEVADSPSVRLQTLRRVLPPDVAVSHRAALWVLGLDVLDEVVDVTVPRGRHLARRAGLRVHTAALPDDQLCEVSGLLVVSASRAFADVARSESLVEAVAVGDAVLRSGAATREALEEAVEIAGGLRGVAGARLVLPHLEPRSESLMESRVRMTLVLGGVPRPAAQHDLYDDAGHIARADFHLDGLVIEYDGRAQRLDKAAFVADRRRQTRIAEVGCELRRLTSHDYYVRPRAAVCAEVLRAVAQARGRDRSRVRSGPDTLPAPRLTPLPTRADVNGQVAAAERAPARAS
jgi:hypothetical protein